MARIVWHDSEFMEELHNKMCINLEKAAKIVEELAILDVPVKTGKLRSSIRHEVDKNERIAYIGSDIYYSGYVEQGTVKMAARPYLRSQLVKDSVKDAMIIK